MRVEVPLFRERSTHARMNRSGSEVPATRRRLDAIETLARFSSAIFLTAPALLRASEPEIFAIFGILLVIVCARLIAKHREFSPDRSDIACAAFFTPLAGCFGHQVVFVVWAGVAVANLDSKDVRSLLSWAWPLATLLVATVAAEFVVGVPAWMRFEAFRSGDTTVLEASRAWVSTWCPSWIPSSHWMTMLLLTALLSPGRRSVAGWAVSAGSIVAMAAVLLQSFGAWPIDLPNSSSFWRGINRVAGTFTDPNAAGIFLALLPFVTWPLLASSKFPRALAYLCIVPWCAAGLATGSRSFLLAVAFGIALTVFARRPRLAIPVLTAVAGVVSVVSLIDASTNLVSQTLEASALPEGLRRGIGALSLLRLDETLYSRSVFFDLSRTVFESRPLVGVGPDRFRHFVPAAARQLGIDIGTWVDNSNNFYSGLVVEWGLLGAAVFAITAARRRPEHRNRVEMLGLVVLAIVLVTGPHTDFGEVAFVAAFLFAAGSCAATSCIGQAPGVRQVNVLVPVVAAAAVILSFVRAATAERGGHEWEREGAAYHQWISPAARLTVACTCDGKRELLLQADRAAPDDPIDVRLTFAGRVHQIVRFTKAGVKEVGIPCPPPPTGAPTFRPPRMTIEVAVMRPANSLVSEAGVSSADRSHGFRSSGIRIRNRPFWDVLGERYCMTPSSDASRG